MIIKNLVLIANNSILIFKITSSHITIRRRLYRLIDSLNIPFKIDIIDINKLYINNIIRILLLLYSNNRFNSLFLLLDRYSD